MKRVGLYILVAMLSVGLAGCPGSRDADPVGTWLMDFDWECDGGAESVVWHIYDNETFISSSGANGTWSVDRKDITLNYTNGTIYGGEVSGDEMSGTMNSVTARTGCWAASRTSDTP